MNHQLAKEALDKIVGQIFGYQNPYNPDQFAQKFAFDVRLPVQVNDSTTGEATWSQSANPVRYITMKNARNRTDDNMRPKRQLESIQDILATWNEVNMTTTERQIESLNVAESDNIYNSENVFHSQDIHRSKNILFSDGVLDSEFVAASQRTNSNSFCIRLEDSKECSNSFSAVWSAKIVNCLFVQDCYDMYECMFCANVTSRKFCIANMQFEESEYRQLKDMVVRWILTS